MLKFWGLPVVIVDQVFPALGYHVHTTMNAKALECLVFPPELPEFHNDN